MNKVFILTMGCSKNDVDSETMAYKLKNNDYTIINNPSDADYIIINTCSFINAAKEESIDAIFDMINQKKDGAKIIVSGCLAQRYSKELKEEIPEIDIIVGTGNFQNISEIIKEYEENNKDDVYIDNINADIEYIEKDVADVTEYVKIAEGCNNNCSYCIIPKLRGRLRSRPIDDIVNEINHLHKLGTKEVILIAQNTTDYGMDIYSRPSLDMLLKAILERTKMPWIRIMYLYPDNITDDLIETFNSSERILKYMDIPLQHASDHVLKMMNRHIDKDEIHELITKLRTKIADLVLRTTFIVGFPGEREEDFEELLNFIKKEKFDKLGVFEYSDEEGTRSYSFNEKLDEKTKAERREKIMDAQMDISRASLEKRVGTVMKCLVEDGDAGEYTLRSFMDAPDVDGQVYVTSDKDLEIGSFVDVKIIEALEYDLRGEIYEPSK
ncbi:30S ribosomal protein S12 methylthiotransferase RimO [Fenollaria massiliensis]|uniref:Ribosomal protein uS12 methylthiotransferase RimO n=1 Tax=Fenollaria massiliensis TaxID=938288 RepID=A0A9E7DIR0_9FIRM|nr:30S ribosomal protein S12 methylthiotransferase RimO [Fenollaria massiliensis]UQK58577.1 30S ribosomal protein S12 methylthiotransferase RimO [Fenollaria massiliensis]